MSIKFTTWLRTYLDTIETTMEKSLMMN